MSRCRLEIRPSVEKTLRKIRDARLQQRLDETFTRLSENPRRTGTGKIYEIHDALLLVLILAVGNRKEIYR